MLVGAGSGVRVRVGVALRGGTAVGDNRVGVGLETDALALVAVGWGLVAVYVGMGVTEGGAVTS